MITFLPYPDFKKSAQCLDMRRLGNQRTEALQILESILEIRPWKNHSINKMWKNYDQALAVYGIRMCEEWIRRGYQDNLLTIFLSARSNTIPLYPPWSNDFKFHYSHRANLVRKNTEHYLPIFSLDYPGEIYNQNGPEPYVWLV